MRWRAFSIAIVFLGSVSSSGSGFPVDRETSAKPLIRVANETKEPEPATDIFAVMSGKCSTLRVAGRDFSCRAVAYFHREHGRANFAIALNDPADDSHVVSFSGENSRRDQDNLYELQIDRMLLNSKDRPKTDGLPVPLAEPATGLCKQVGSFGTSEISSISCNATDRNGKKYELRFESDGSPMIVRKIKQRPLGSESLRVKKNAQLECRHQANAAKILPRDWTAYILRCLAEDAEKPATGGPQ
jgi:hypothetical protein